MRVSLKLPNLTPSSHSEELLCQKQNVIKCLEIIKPEELWFLSSVLINQREIPVNSSISKHFEWKEKGDGEGEGSTDVRNIDQLLLARPLLRDQA